MMKRYLFSLSLLFSLVVSTPALAQQVEIKDAWMRATLSGRNISAGYMQLSNTGDQAITFTAVTWPENSPLSGRLEIHETQSSDGIMQMMPLEDGVVISAGETIVFEPRGRHIMLMGLSRAVEKDEQVTLRLIFDMHEAMDITFSAR